MDRAILRLTPSKDYEEHAAQKLSSIFSKCINWDITAFNLCSMRMFTLGQQNQNDKMWKLAHPGKMKVLLLHLQAWQAIDCSSAKPWGSSLTIVSPPCMIPQHKHTHPPPLYRMCAPNSCPSISLSLAHLPSSIIPSLYFLPRKSFSGWTPSIISAGLA